jgi:hypothetical protein
MRSSSGLYIKLFIKVRWTWLLNVTHHTLVEHGQHSTTQHSTTQHNTAQHSTAQHNTAQHNTAQHSTTQHNTAQHNTTQHSTAQHSTTQHNTTQHSTAQHSTALYSFCDTLYNNHTEWHSRTTQCNLPAACLPQDNLPDNTSNITRHIYASYMAINIV